MSVYVCITPEEIFFLQRHREFLSREDGAEGGWLGVMQNDFFKVARCLRHVKCFTIFYFN